MQLPALIGSILLVALNWACTQNTETTPHSQLKEYSVANIETNLQHSAPAIPLIDTVAAAHFETATFGLG